MRASTLLATAALIAATSLAACGGNDNSSSSGPPDNGGPPSGASTGPAGAASSSGSGGMSESGSSGAMSDAHTPMAPLTATASADEIYQMSKPGVFLLYGKSPTGTYSGTAFIHDLEGEMAITNAHVVDGLTSIKAVFFDGSQAPVHVMGTDPCTDLAVVHISGPLPAGSVRLPLGDSDALAPGDTVTSLGYPQTASTDYVHAPLVPTTGTVQDPKVTVDYYASLPNYVNAIQHGATIQHGNSGGPLTDDKGNVVGINALDGPPGTEGQYYAIPINAAHDEAEKLMTGESVNNLGWTLDAHSENPLNTYSIYGKDGRRYETELRRGGLTGGMFVTSVTPGSPIEGRVATADLILKMSGTPVNSDQDVCDIIESTLPGRTLTVDGIHLAPGAQGFGREFHVEFTMPGTH